MDIHWFKWGILGAGIIGALGLLGCTPTQLFNAVNSGGSFDIRHDVSYGERDVQQLDIYTPRRAKPGAPIVVFFYGGAWQGGDKESYRFAAEAFAGKGYLTILPDYRTYPHGVFPDFMIDAAKAMAWVHREYGGRKIVVMGHSAGGHIAALLSLDARYLRAEGLSHTDVIAGWVGMAGTYDFGPFTDPPYDKIFPAELYEQTQPINFTEGATIPAFLMTGEEDSVVPAQNVRTLDAALRSEGTPVMSAYYEDLGHMGIVVRLSKILRRQRGVRDNIIRFMDSLDKIPDKNSGDNPHDKLGRSP